MGGGGGGAGGWVVVRGVMGEGGEQVPLLVLLYPWQWEWVGDGGAGGLVVVGQVGW